jgi:hypothetical protein
LEKTTLELICIFERKQWQPILAEGEGNWKQKLDLFLSFFFKKLFIAQWHSLILQLKISTIECL